jgi:hypothetical protein
MFSGYTDEVEAFGFMIIENGRGVYGPYHIHTQYNSTYVYIDVAFEFTFPTNRTMLLLTDDAKLSLRRLLDRAGLSVFRRCGC